MMRRCTTAVLEQGNLRSASFATEPFEAGWAGEARWFLRILDPQVPEAGKLRVMPQISPDGILWCDDEDSTAGLDIAIPAGQETVFTVAQRGFGNWARLRVDLGDTGEQPVKFLIYLVLKE